MTLVGKLSDRFLANRWTFSALGHCKLLTGQVFVRDGRSERSSIRFGNRLLDAGVRCLGVPLGCTVQRYFCRSSETTSRILLFFSLLDGSRGLGIRQLTILIELVW